MNLFSKLEVERMMGGAEIPTDYAKANVYWTEWERRLTDTYGASVAEEAPLPPRTAPPSYYAFCDARCERNLRKRREEKKNTISRQ